VRAFAAVSRRRSFSAAARELGISQPAVSKHIADIERRLGVRLVERRPRGGDLTAAGAFLADYVLRAEALLAQAARGVTEFRQSPTGSLTIAASGVPATYLAPRDDCLLFIGEAPPKDGGFWRIRNGDGLRHRLLSLLVSSERSVGEIERELRLRSDSGFPSASDTLRKCAFMKKSLRLAISTVLQMKYIWNF